MGLVTKASLEYEMGARNFVSRASSSLGKPTEMFCPCVDCRNVCHQAIETVLDHLVIRGMDEKYRRNPCWSKHGEKRNKTAGDVPGSENEAYDLIRTAFFESEGNDEQHNGDEFEECESLEESEFREKLRDAETPLYSTCDKYSKVSAITVLYRIKVKSGDAKVWRPNSEVKTISDAIGTTVAWSNDKIVFV